MNYRSIADLNDTLLRQRWKLPADVDLVVGIPRSGLLAANLLSLSLNVPMTDIDGLVAGRLLTSGRSRRRKCFDTTTVRTARSILIIDDSVFMGQAMRDMRRKIENLDLPGKITTCAVYGNDERHPDCDVVLEAIPQPRMFQWNVMHHGLLKHCCVDIDGVLCCDPTEDQNDDGEAYLRFLAAASPVNLPTQKIGWLVTSRLEKYRPQTEAWLEAHGVDYEHLVMLDLASKEERLRSGAHGTYKADVYKKLDAVLFIESDVRQAEQIAKLSGKPVLCVETQHVIQPPGLSLATATASMRTLPRRIRLSKSPLTNAQALAVKLRQWLGPDHYATLRGLARRTPLRRRA